MGLLKEMWLTAATVFLSKQLKLLLEKSPFSAFLSYLSEGDCVELRCFAQPQYVSTVLSKSQSRRPSSLRPAYIDTLLLMSPSPAH